MLVQFDNRRIVIDRQGLLYDPYYFALAGEDAGIIYADVVKVVMAQWAEAIEQLEGGSVFLPFGLEDQATECLEAKAVERNVILRCVWLDFQGWGVDLLHLEAFMNTSHSIIQSSPQNFGVFNRSKLIAALRRPETINNAGVKRGLT